MDFPLHPPIVFLHLTAAQHKETDTNPYLFPPPQKCGVCVLCITTLQNLRVRRKSYDHTKHLGLGDSSRQGAKSAKFG